MILQIKLWEFKEWRFFNNKVVEKEKRQESLGGVINPPYMIHDCDSFCQYGI